MTAVRTDKIAPVATDPPAETVVVLDFETSGMSPKRGHRAIEVGAVKVQGRKVIDRFDSLINPGFAISPFIEQLTGICNRDLLTAPCADQVMSAFYDFIGDHPLIAHNASFDRAFLDAELYLLGLERRQPFACTLMVARRVFPDAPNYKLATLVHVMSLQHRGVFHRALADAEMTAQLWTRMEQTVADRCGVEWMGFEQMRSLGEMPKRKARAFFQQALNV